MKQLLKSTATFTVPMGPVQGYMNETPDGPAKREKLDPFTTLIMATALQQPLPYQQKRLTLLSLKWRMSGTTKSP